MQFVFSDVVIAHKLQIGFTVANAMGEDIPPFFVVAGKECREIVVRGRLHGVDSRHCDDETSIGGRQVWIATEDQAIPVGMIPAYASNNGDP